MRSTKQENHLNKLFVCYETVSMAAVYQLKISIYDRVKFEAVFLDAKSAVALLLKM